MLCKNKLRQEVARIIHSICGISEELNISKVAVTFVRDRDYSISDTDCAMCVIVCEM